MLSSIFCFRRTYIFTELTSEQSSLALLVTNLQIVVMIVYRRLRRRNHNRDSQIVEGPRIRPFDSDAGTAMHERPRRTGFYDTAVDMEDYETSVPSYTVASIAPSSLPLSMPPSLEATPVSVFTPGHNT